MPKLLTALAALGFTALVALPAPAGASERRADGLRNLDQVEVSSARRKYRRHYVRRYWGPPPYAYGGPYYAPYYAYGYPYRYYRPGPFISVGPFGFGFGF